MSILRSARPLLVYPNPFHALDHKGRATCAVRRDPAKEISGGRRIWIGAEIGSATRIGAARDEDDGRYDVHDRTWKFDLSAPTGVEDTDHHRAAVRNGELIAANVSTARRASRADMSVKFRDPLEVLRAEQEAAVAHWMAEHPDDEELPPAAALVVPKTVVTPTNTAPAAKAS